MSHAANDGHVERCDRTSELLIVKSLQILIGAAAANQQNDIRGKRLCCNQRRNECSGSVGTLNQTVHMQDFHPRRAAFKRTQHIAVGGSLSARHQYNSPYKSRNRLFALWGKESFSLQLGLEF